MGPIRQRLHTLYYGDTPAAHAFRYALLAFDVTMIVFIVVSSFLPDDPVIEVLDIVFGLGVLADFSGRLLATRKPWRELAHPATLADLVVIVSLLAPAAGEQFAFLRVLRALRLLRTYALVSRMRRDFPFFRRNQQAITAVINLFVFVFVMTALVYETQHARNPGIGNYADALYFTVTTLTTTGFGDITLQGQTGRLLSVLIMIFGVSLFIRLIQVLFRPPRIAWRCTQCGLSRHEPDAIHCRHCGVLLNIPHEERA
jgi:voltage-gated potassium channel